MVVVGVTLCADIAMTCAWRVVTTRTCPHLAINVPHWTSSLTIYILSRVPQHTRFHLFVGRNVFSLVVCVCVYLIFLDCVPTTGRGPRTHTHTIPRGVINPCLGYTHTLVFDYGL